MYIYTTIAVIGANIQRDYLLDFDHKRLHFFHRMYHATDEYLAATHEQISMHIDVRGPKGAPMAERIIERLESLFEAHSKQPRPSQSVRPIGIRRK